MQEIDLSKSFKEDCLYLIESFTKYDSPLFNHFCDEWKHLNFQYIFHGHYSDYEIIDFVEDSMNVIKHLFLDGKNILDRLGCLYLMYCFFYKQPMKEYCKIRFTCEEWQVMRKFYNEINIINEYDQGKLIFWKLFNSGAFRFVQAEVELGFEHFMHKNVDKRSQSQDFKKINSTIEPTLMSMQDERFGIFPALNILECAYNEMKEHIDLAESTKQRSELLPPTSFVTDILNGIKTIENNFKIGKDSLSNGERIVRSKGNIGQKRSNIKKKAMELDVKKKTKELDVKKKAMEQNEEETEAEVHTVEEQIQINKSVDKPTIVFNEETEIVKIYSRNRSYAGRKKAPSLAIKQLDFSEETEREITTENYDTPWSIDNTNNDDVIKNTDNLPLINDS